MVRIAKRAEQARLLAIKEATEADRAMEMWAARREARLMAIKEAAEVDMRVKAQEEQARLNVPAVVPRKKKAPWILTKKQVHPPLDRTAILSLTRCLSK